jgi:hypothetical protein
LQRCDHAMRVVAMVLLVVLPGDLGCYHFTFEQQRGRGVTAPMGGQEPADASVTYMERVPTYLNGFIGNGRVDTYRYCEHPLRTELRVTGMDVLLGAATLLIYTPHTLYVTCPR